MLPSFFTATIFFVAVFFIEKNRNSYGKINMSVIKYS